MHSLSQHIEKSINENSWWLLEIALEESLRYLVEIFAICRNLQKVPLVPINSHEVHLKLYQAKEKNQKYKRVLSSPPLCLEFFLHPSSNRQNLFGLPQHSNVRHIVKDEQHVPIARSKFLHGELRELVQSQYHKKVKNN